MIYEQHSGKIWTDDKSAIIDSLGYSGHGKGKNNPLMQNIKDVGPIPCGKYYPKNPHHSDHTGPFTIDLIPFPDNEMFGRSEFKIHGDNIEKPGTASEGCIIFGPDTRHLIWYLANIHNETLTVIP